MKRKLFISSLFVIILALFLVACREEPVVEEEDNSKIMEDFSQVASGNNPLEIKEFVDENIENLSQEEANEMIDTLEASLVNNLAAVADRLYNMDQDYQLIEIGAVDFFFNEEKIDEIEREELRNEVENIFASGYKLVNIEGSYNPIVDYAKLEEYNPYISEEWIDYLEVRAMDSNSPPFVDAAMMIEYDELAARIIKTEDYLTNYPEASRVEEMLDIYENKIDIYLRGIPNTPIAEYDTNIIHDSVYNSYVNTSQETDTVTGDIVATYLEAIDANDRVVDLEILNLGKELATEAIDSL